MQIALLEVYDAFARLVLYIGVANVPFLWDSPVEDLGTGRNLMEHQGDSALKQAQALAQTVASDAPADWVKGLDNPVGFLTLAAGVNGLQHVAERAFCELGFI